MTIWGLIGVVPYMAYALLHFFHSDTGYGFYLQMVLAPQEIVMGLWLVIKGFNVDAVKALDEAHELHPRLVQRTTSSHQTQRV